VVLALQQAWARERPGIAVHTTEGHTAGLIELLDSGHLDLVIGWCPIHVPGVRFERLKDERLVAHISSEHPLAAEQSVTLERLAQEPILVGSGPGSAGYTAGIIATFERAGLHPQTVQDPYPDAGLLAAIEGRSITVGPIQQFDDVSAEISVLEVEPPCTLPFELAWRDPDESAPLTAILAITRRVRDANGWLLPDKTGMTAEAC
jgi:DNA-binding transcriptional LysR family regulator